jgi:hypothetical protein
MKIDVVYKKTSPDGKNFGNKLLKTVVLEKKPKYCLFGHIHSSPLKELTTYEDVNFANVSILGEDYKVQYDPLVFEFNPHVPTIYERLVEAEEYFVVFSLNELEDITEYEDWGFDKLFIKVEPVSDVLKDWKSKIITKLKDNYGDRIEII